MSPLFLFSIPLGMNQTTYVEVLGWTQSNSYCLIFFTSGKLNKWTGSKCALGFKASVLRDSKNLEYRIRDGIKERSVWVVTGSGKGVCWPCETFEKKVGKSISGSWAEVFPASPVPPLSRRGTDLQRSPSSFSCPGSQLSRLRSSNVVKNRGAGIAHIKQIWDKNSTCKPIPIHEKRSGHKAMIEAAKISFFIPLSFLNSHQKLGILNFYKAVYCLFVKISRFSCCL